MLGARLPRASPARGKQARATWMMAHQRPLRQSVAEAPPAFPTRWASGTVGFPCPCRARPGPSRRRRCPQSACDKRRDSIAILVTVGEWRRRRSSVRKWPQRDERAALFSLTRWCAASGKRCTRCFDVALRAHHTRQYCLETSERRLQGSRGTAKEQSDSRPRTWHRG